MKSIFQGIATITLVLVSATTHANNWQWQLDQVKLDRQRTEQRKLVVAEGKFTCPQRAECRCDEVAKSSKPSGRH